MRSERKLTTGEIAQYCGVNFRTVIRWIERGELLAYQLPGRGDNRVTLGDFLIFLERHHMPIPEELQPRSKRILIVEDDALLAKGMEKALRGQGFETRSVGNGFAAGSALHAFSPALLTLDLQMPGMDGFAVLDHLRRTNDLPPVKVLVVSAKSRSELQRALGAGAHDVLQKPFTNTELVEKATQLLHAEGPALSKSRSKRDVDI